MRALQAFDAAREKGNQTILTYAGRDIKRFFSIDATVYETGALPSKVKEMLGLATSAVLRCDDCITHHLKRAFEEGISDEEIVEVFSIAMVVGGSITIPHIRRALLSWDRMRREVLYKEILAEIAAISDIPLEDRLKAICTLLDERIDTYDWTGFYIVDSPGMLRLGPYVGEPTDHTFIPFGKGICGQAAATGKNFVIDDVSAQSNYLSCSFKVRSEIVVPVFRDGELWGELDIDSHTPAAFDDLDEWLLGEIAKII